MTQDPGGQVAMDGKLPLVVLAANYSHFVHWCRAQGVSPNNHRRVRYVGSASGLQGLRSPVFFYETFLWRRDALEITSVVNQALVDVLGEAAAANYVKDGWS